MKNFTMLLLMLFGAVSFAQQTTLKENGVDNPTHYSQQQKPKSVVIPESQRKAEAEILNLDKTKPSVESQRQTNPKVVIPEGQRAVEANIMIPESQRQRKSEAADTRSRTPEKSATFDESHVPVFGGKQPSGNNNVVQLEKTLFGTAAQEEILAAEAENAKGAYSVSSFQNGEGQNKIMAQIIPTAGATESFAVDAGDFFYDPSDGVTGGPGGDCSTTSSGDPGDYPNCNCTTVTTLTGTDLSVEFLTFRVFGTFDYLNIYDGPNTSSPKIYDSNLNSDTDTLAGMIAAHGSGVFNSTTDALTFEFHATSVVNTCGWEVEVLSGGGGGGPFPAPYCDVTYGTVEPISLVEVAGISNRSSEVIDGSPAHEDFTSVVGNMVEGDSYTIALEGNTNGGFTCSFTVFIDWNQDGILDNASERYEIGTINSSTGIDGKQATNTITVPAGVVDGPTRMRVLKRFGSTYSVDSCTGTSWGQAEDYTINVTAGGGTGTVCANPILEVNQDVDDTCMATIGQGGLAQSYIPLETEAAGAGIKFRDPSTGLDVDLSLWDGLPNAGGVMLASGTSQTDGTNWADVLWDPVVNVTVGDTYYIVIDGDAALPCVSGSTNNPYAGGMTYANNYSPFPNFDYTFRTFSCDTGGGTGGPCAQSHPFGVDAAGGSGSSVDSDFKTAADIIVVAGEDFTLDTIEVPFLTFAPLDPPTTANIVYYAVDAAGLPGAVIGSETVVPTILSSSPWANPVAFQFMTSLDVTPFTFAGDANSDTTYWIEVSMGTATNQGTVFWEYTDDIPVEGQPYAKFDASVGTWEIEDPAQEVIYTFSGECEPMGGSTACAQDHPFGAIAAGGSGSSVDSDFKTAADIVVATGEDFTLNNIEVPFLTFAPLDPPTTANVVYYAVDAAGLPGAVIGSETVVPTILSSSPWANPVAFQFMTSLDVTPFTFSGDATSDTTYWIEVSMGTATNQGTVFWEYTDDIPVEGQPYAKFDATVGTWEIEDPAQEVIYTFSGDCEPMAPGNPCATTGPSNNMEDGKSFTKNLGRIVANDITIADGEDMMLETINISAFIGSVGSGVNASNVDVFIYRDSGTGSPGDIINTQLSFVPTSQTVIGNNFGYDLWDVELDITDVYLPGQIGSTTTYWIGLSLEPTDGSNTFWEYSSAGVIGYGLAYDDGSGYVMEPANEGVYTFAGTCSPATGIPFNDGCSGAFALSCGDSVSGQTTLATDSGGNPAPDVFYKYTGSGAAQFVTISLCGGGTDYDSVLRIFDDCDLSNEIAMNDDFCGSQSEVTFLSDGTSTYYIMVEGFGSNSGNFSLDVTCMDPLPNDFCTGAIAMNCGESVTGTTVGATIDSDAPTCGPSITSPGVWYSFDDNRGMPGELTFSLCDGSTNFDTKLSVYKGTCAALECVAGNDDFCGLQSEVTITSDGNTKYYILVHSFGGATGTFTLDVICTPTPPPNDEIANSIYVSDIGFPYTDPAVAMPAATTEDGNPQDCDLTGANGVWYHFTSAGDGIAEATIITPGGASSVTFYSAPSLNAVETDLVLVPQNSNQCVPGTSASIYTLAGEIYYVFVLNSGAVTDIVIDGTNLGVSNNTLEGFTYYPNPTNGVLNLSSKDNIEMVTIYNLLGQTVLTDNVGATSATLDISGLSVGTYMMKATVNGQVGVYKIVKK